MSLLRELSGHPEYMAMLKKAKEMMPDIPPWDPKAENIEDWKFKSAKREGFELCLIIFTPK